MPLPSLSPHPEIERRQACHGYPTQQRQKQIREQTYDGVVEKLRCVGAREVMHGQPFQQRQAKPSDEDSTVAHHDADFIAGQQPENVAGADGIAEDGQEIEKLR